MWETGGREEAVEEERGFLSGRGAAVGFGEVGAATVTEGVGGTGVLTVSVRGVGDGVGVEVEVGRGGGGAFLLESVVGVPEFDERIDATDEGRLRGFGILSVRVADLRSGLEVFVESLEEEESTLARGVELETADRSTGGGGGALTGDRDIADAAAGGLR